MLLAYGADPNAQNSENTQTALIKAVRNNYSETIVDMLLKQEANPNIPDVNGETALMVISRSDRNHSNLVKTLIEAGADHIKEINTVEQL